MSLLTTLETKYGHLAIPRIITVLAGFQALNWFLIKLVPQFVEKLAFVPQAIWQGEVWRLVSYVLLPGSDSIIWLLFIGFMFMLNDGLEEAWGAFRLNLFMLAGIVFIAIGGMIFGFSTTGSILWLGVLFAFACFFPNQEIMLYFIIPLKIKWVAWISAGLLGFALVGGGLGLWLESFFSLLNFFVAFGPGLLKGVSHVAKVNARRQRYAAAQQPENEALHRCVKCSKTEEGNPQLDFRVNADGDDVCSECRVPSGGER
jgi:hypothetical protein